MATQGRAQEGPGPSRAGDAPPHKGSQRKGAASGALEQPYLIFFEKGYPRPDPDYFRARCHLEVSKDRTVPGKIEHVGQYPDPAKDPAGFWL